MTASPECEPAGLLQGRRGLSIQVYVAGRRAWGAIVVALLCPILLLTFGRDFQLPSDGTKWALYVVFAVVCLALLILAAQLGTSEDITIDGAEFVLHKRILGLRLSRPGLLSDESLAEVLFEGGTGNFSNTPARVGSIVAIRLAGGRRMKFGRALPLDKQNEIADQINSYLHNLAPVHNTGQGSSG